LGSSLLDVKGEVILTGACLKRDWIFLNHFLLWGLFLHHWFWLDLLSDLRSFLLLGLGLFGFSRSSSWGFFGLFWSCLFLGWGWSRCFLRSWRLLFLLGFGLLLSFIDPSFLRLRFQIPLIKAEHAETVDSQAHKATENNRIILKQDHDGLTRVILRRGAIHASF